MKKVIVLCLLNELGFIIVINLRFLKIIVWLYSFKILDLFIWFILELLLYDWYLLVKIVLKYLLNGGLEVRIY